MNGRIKIYSKANMLDQYAKMSLVLIITVLLSLILNNSYILGEIIAEKTHLNQTLSFMPELAVKTIFFAFLGLVSYVLLMPFRYGRDIWFYENAKKNRLKLRNLFSFYKVRKSFSAIRLIFAVEVRKFFITFLFMIPSLVIAGYLFYSLREGIGGKLLLALSISVVLLSLSAFFFSFIFSQRYFLAEYLFYENESCRARDAIALSAKIMEKKCFETAFLKMSFIGWFLLCLLIFPTLYVYPFYKISISIKAISLLANT